MKLRTILLAMNGATFFLALVAIAIIFMPVMPIAGFMGMVHFHAVVFFVLVPLVFVLNVGVIAYQLVSSKATVRIQDHLFIVLSVNMVIWYFVFWTF